MRESHLQVQPTTNYLGLYFSGPTSIIIISFMTSAILKKKVSLLDKNVC